MSDETESTRTDWGDCLLCTEPIWRGDAWQPINGDRLAHRECLLREVIGGIGHLIAHSYWCSQHRDPDAGLTYRQSALLVDAFVTVMGVDAAATRG